MGSQGQSAGYAMAYAPTPQRAAAIAADPEWQILRNDKHTQMVYFKDGTVMAAFFSAGSLTHPKIQLEVSQPCLILIAGNKMYISDPDRTGKDVRVKWNNVAMDVTLPLNGETKVVNGADEQ
jgi:hypothetical protein